MEGLTLKLKLQYFGHLMCRADLLEKTIMQGKLKAEGEGMTEDEMVGWYHRLKGYEFEQTLRDGEGQGSLVCCSPSGRRVGHDGATEQQSSLPGLSLS